MSISYNIDVHCDKCGNWISAGNYTKPNMARKALAKAKKVGWSRNVKSEYVDLCPDCLTKYR